MATTTERSQQVESMSIEDALHWIAQGAINIDEGTTKIEAGSRVHVAMHAICHLAQTGKLHYEPKH